MKYDTIAQAYKRLCESVEHPMIDVDGVMKHRNNSLGQPIHHTDEGIINFHRWFGDSKVVDEHGRPKVLYHGTGGIDIEEFRKSALGVNTKVKSAYGGFFFTNSPDNANEYAGGSTSRRGYISRKDIMTSWSEEDIKEYERLEAHRDSLKPPRTRHDGWMMTDEWRSRNKKISDFFDATVDKMDAGNHVIPVYISIKNPLIHDMKGQKYRDVSYAELIKQAKAKKKNGVIIKNTYDPKFGDVHISFNPNQIKSAIGNSGNFSSESNKIIEDLDIPSTEYITEDVSKKIHLNKPFTTTGHSTMYAVYVKNDAGKTVIVRFNPPTMHTDMSKPHNIEVFRKRHLCDTATDPTRPRYWSCRYWEAGVKDTTISESVEHPMIDVDGVMKHRNNSLGQPIHHTDEGIRNFHRWSAGNVMTDDQGRPKVFYHGTSSDTDYAGFKIPKSGAWFTDNKESASDYAKENDSQDIKYENGRFVHINTASRVIPVYLKADSIHQMSSSDFDEINKSNYKKAQGILFDRLRGKNHDMISHGGGVYTVIGNPAQIKSAIGNTGKFSTKSKKISEMKTIEQIYKEHIIEEDFDISSTEYITEEKEKSVKLNKPFRTPGKKKKFAVYVKNSSGKVVIVRFGDPNMEIKRDDPERRKAFRSRHSCDTATDKTTPRYWSCKFWEAGKTVSSLTEDISPDVIVRRATPQDIPHVVALDRHFPGNTWSSYMFNKPEYTIHVAQDSNTGDHIGYIATRKEGDQVLISKMLTHPDYRGYGIGSMLMQHAIGINPNSDIILNVRTHNTPAINMYKKHGFVIDHEKPEYYSNGDDAYHMIRTGE